MKMNNFDNLEKKTEKSYLENRISLLNVPLMCFMFSLSEFCPTPKKTEISVKYLYQEFSHM